MAEIERPASDLANYAIAEKAEGVAREKIDGLLESLASTESNPWILVDTHLFDEHLKDIGVPWVMRKAICAFSPSEQRDRGRERERKTERERERETQPFLPVPHPQRKPRAGQIITHLPNGANICVRTPMIDVITPAKVGEKGTNSRGSDFDTRVVVLTRKDEQGQAVVALETRVHLNEQSQKKDIVSLRFRDGKHMALMMYCQDDEGDRKISEVKCVRTFTRKGS